MTLNFYEGSDTFMKKLKFIQTLGMVMLLFISFVATDFTAEAKKQDDPAQRPIVVVINPGCQEVENKQKESVGPGAWSRVAEDMVGAKGAVTENNEYDLNLEVAKKTQKALLDKGFVVQMTRTTNDVDINNAERAMVANTIDADLYISIYSSSKSKKDAGVSVMCETADNPYNFGAYKECRLLADTLLGSISERTSYNNGDVVETDDLIGINWCTVPNAMVRVGNLNNEADDEKLAAEEYQQQLAEGIAAGVESYFTQK